MKITIRTLFQGPRKVEELPKTVSAYTCSDGDSLSMFLDFNEVENTTVLIGYTRSKSVKEPRCSSRIVLEW